MNWPAGKKSQYRYLQFMESLEDKVRQIESYLPPSLVAVLIPLASINQETEFSNIKAIIHISETNHMLMDLNKWA